MSAEIAVILGQWSGRGRFVDAFCGTGVVASKAAALGWPVVLNDHLASSVAMATGQLVSANDVDFKALGGYARAASLLDSLPGTHGFIWSEYSPASRRHGVERRYFTEENAARIDAIRAQIATWSDAGAISAVEARLLVADLLVAVNRIANIAGTYGCFLRDWTRNARVALRFAPRILQTRSATVEVSCADVFDVTVQDEDTLYLDPPYTKRQYAAYYHILETVAEGDAPTVGGVTGLRPWEHKASPFCYKTRALDALISLVEILPAQRVLLSYSDQGHIPLAALRLRLGALGDVHERRLKTIGRYRPNYRAATNGASVAEYLLELLRRPDHRSANRDRSVAA